MDIQKEREAFEKLIDIEIIISEGFKFNPNINQYYHPDHTNHRLSYAYLMGSWMVWQEKAQAVPENKQFNLDEFLTMEEKLKHKGGVITADLDRFIAYAEMVLEKAKALKEPK